MLSLKIKRKLYLNKKVVLKYELEANFGGSDEGYSSRPHSIPDGHHHDVVCRLRTVLTLR